MTRQSIVAKRRAFYQELAARDAANRCGICKRNLREADVVRQDVLLPGKFCSENCLAEARERRAD